MERNITLENMINRKSVHHFKNATLSVDILEELKNSLFAMDKLFNSADFSATIVSASAMKRTFSIKAPYYLVLSSKKTPSHFMNIGFMVQQFDLYLNAIGLGGCWAGLAKPSSKVNQELLGGFVIAYAFGEPDASGSRTLEQYPRKNLSSIAEGQDHLDLIHYARLAPSPANRQPWYFVTSPSSIDIYRISNNFLKATAIDKLDQISIGVVAAHIHVAGYLENKPLTFDIKEVSHVEAILGYQYMLSAKINP